MMTDWVQHLVLWFMVICLGALTSIVVLVACCMIAELVRRILGK